RYQHHGLKSVEAMSNVAQQMVAKRDYDAFGNVIASTGTWGSAFGYAGGFGYQEDATGLKLLGHRYFDSFTGRFLTRDPIKDGRNWYSYAENDPVNLSDPDGLRGRGHHFIPTEFWKGGRASSDAAKVWNGNGAISGPLSEPHYFDNDHRQYNEAVGEIISQYEQKYGRNRRNFTKDDARRILNLVMNSSDPRIRRFITKILRQAKEWRDAHPRSRRWAGSNLPRSGSVPSSYGNPVRPGGIRTGGGGGGGGGFMNNGLPWYRSGCK
nr:RHS repeat-associated core domain-containing protein [Fimbriimonadaceae bacterium]